MGSHWLNASDSSRSVGAAFAMVYAWSILHPEFTCSTLRGRNSLWVLPTSTTIPKPHPSFHRHDVARWQLGIPGLAVWYRGELGKLVKVMVSAFPNPLVEVLTKGDVFQQLVLQFPLVLGDPQRVFRRPGSLVWGQLMKISDP